MGAPIPPCYHLQTPVTMGGNSPSRYSAKTLSKLIVILIFFLSFQSFFLAWNISSHDATSVSNTIPVQLRQKAGASPSGLNAHATDDGTVTFTPEEFRAGRIENYVNLPNQPAKPETDRHVRELMSEPVPDPAEVLLHKAPTPPGPNAIVGLASYKEFMRGWRKLVGSLRINGYDGHIILGVNKDMPQRERIYLDAMGVTYYAIETANCSASILDGTSSTTNSVRGTCSRGLEDLKLEWGRYEMARRWLHACDTCTGWSMVIDTRDIFFQADPFTSLGDPMGATHDLLFVEEIGELLNAIMLTTTAVFEDRRKN